MIVSPHRRALLLAAVASGGVACGGDRARVAFHPTDTSFRAAPGPAPRVYLAADVGEVPPVKLRSVGLIEVAVPVSKGMSRAVELAVERGRQLGCWILVEHSIFATVQSRAVVGFGGTIYLTHGGAHFTKTAGPSLTRTEFDCVVRDQSLPMQHAQQTRESSAVLTAR